MEIGHLAESGCNVGGAAAPIVGGYLKILSTGSDFVNPHARLTSRAAKKAPRPATRGSGSGR
jgi:hypothetical protein